MRTKSAGFALMEVIVSIVILSIVMAGAVGLISVATNQVALNKNKISATYLAQECLELVRNARDSAWKQNLPWDCFADDFCLKEKLQFPDEINKSGIVLGGITPSPFWRKMTVEDLPNFENAKKITCEVSWKTKTEGDQNSIKISEVLTHWRKK